MENFQRFIKEEKISSNLVKVFKQGVPYVRVSVQNEYYDIVYENKKIHVYRVNMKRENKPLMTPKNMEELLTLEKNFGIDRGFGSNVTYPGQKKV